MGLPFHDIIIRIASRDSRIPQRVMLILPVHTGWLGFTVYSQTFLQEREQCMGRYVSRPLLDSWEWSKDHRPSGVVERSAQNDGYVPECSRNER